MSLITWTAEQYGTQVDFADEEHRVLFDKLNNLYDLAISSAERTAIGSQLDDLIGYVVEHFAHEEREMVAKNFTGFDTHKAEHVAFISIAADLQKKFHAGEADVTEEVGQLIKGWLDSHIPKFDFGYSAVIS